jgi:3-oxoacyl-[acyl-carrier-protein] synthase III
MEKLHAIITGTGIHDTSTDTIITNHDFKDNVFTDPNGNVLPKPTQQVIEKFEEITGTISRHKAGNGKITSTLAIEAGENAVIDSGVNREEINVIIVGNNFEDVENPSDKIDLVPSFAARIKNHLGINNPYVVAYDIIISGSNAVREFVDIKHYLNLSTKDLVVEVADNEQDGMMEVAECLLPSCSVDRESLNSIVVVHFNTIPSIASKVKTALGITNPKIRVFDVIFGCPGFLQATIQVDTMIKDNKIKKALVIGAEILSRVSEQSDMDCMLYGDGAGAFVMEAIPSPKPVGIFFHKVRSDTLNQLSSMIEMKTGYTPDPANPNEQFLKMKGTRVHRHALNLIPVVIKEALKEANISIHDISKMVFHQPNPLMLQEIALRTFAQYDCLVPDGIMPIIGDTYGNTSVASIPMLYHFLRNNQLDQHHIQSGDTIMFLSIGAGMNINFALYKEP